MTILQLKRGTTAQVAAATPEDGELVVDSTLNRIVIGDGSTTGGKALSVGSSDKLATARAVRTNLASTATASFDGSANINPGVTGTLPIANGGTGNTNGLAASATQLENARVIQVDLSSNLGVNFDGSANVTPGIKGVLPTTFGGTGNTTGLAASSTKLANARTITTNLSSTASESFDGTANIAAGVTGTLPVANGGTGGDTIGALIDSLGFSYTNGRLSIPHGSSGGLFM